MKLENVFTMRIDNDSDVTETKAVFNPYKLIICIGGIILFSYCFSFVRLALESKQQHKEKAQYQYQFSEITDIREYLSAINDSRYSILIGMKDEASRSLNQYILDGLANLGLEISLEGRWFMSYIAVIDKGNLAYEAAGNNGNISYEELAAKAFVKHSGKLSDGSQYKIFSAAASAGRCSIIINGLEYSVNRRGLNFVVYDNITRTVIDSVCFDTWAETLDAVRLPPVSMIIF
ncbi:MAG: hypothetical protein LBH75_09110 [Treponema sp.]|jgi:hypothetical protein|nr:hypothetical protein [Treponema sp.]